jgi:hypothetical protein
LLDLSAAFDTVDHHTLLEDYTRLGITQSAFSLLKSYLVGRTQAVVIGDSFSESKDLQFGVPQGSVLGPILFVAYTSSLAIVLKAHGVAFHLYADDTQIYIRITGIGEVKQKLQILLSDISLWMLKRKLKLNEGKTELIIIRGNNRIDIRNDFGTLTSGQAQLSPVDFVKDIGVIFDQKLSFEKHIKNAVSKCNYHIRNLYSVRKYIDRKSMLTLVHSLIVSQIDYCNCLFYEIPNKHLRRLQSVLNRAARLIFGLPPRHSTTPSLIELHWLPIKARIEFKICLMTYRILKYQEPKYLLELLEPYSSGSGMRLRMADDGVHLNEPRAINERSFNDRSFSYSAPRLYNRLPLYIREINCDESFKKKLKTFLFERAYDLHQLSINQEYQI